MANALAQPVISIAALLERRNPWADWQGETDLGPLSWIQMAALLMHEIRPEWMINQLAHSLDEAKRVTEARIFEWAAEAPDDPEPLLTYDLYRDDFLQDWADSYVTFIFNLKGTPEIDYLRKRLVLTDEGAIAFLWFLLNGIAHAALDGEIDAGAIAKNASWLSELDYEEPAYLSGDEVLFRHLYASFCKRFPRAMPLPEEPETYARYGSPFSDGEIARINLLDNIADRRLRHGPSRFFASQSPVEHDSAWRDGLHSNAWQRALNLSLTPSFHWQRQVAFMLREVSLDEVALRSERIMLDMADATARNVIQEAALRNCNPPDIAFGMWFKWWREHFRHWTDPLRTEIQALCLSPDARFLADWLPRFEPAVFADFIIKTCHARTIENYLGFEPREPRLLRSELFAIDQGAPLRTYSLYHLTVHLWHRFCVFTGCKDVTGHAEINFEVDWSLPLSQQQPGSR